MREKRLNMRQNVKMTPINAPNMRERSPTCAKNAAHMSFAAQHMFGTVLFSLHLTTNSWDYNGTRERGILASVLPSADAGGIGEGDLRETFQASATMSKTAAGFVLIGGLFLALVSGTLGASLAHGRDLDPTKDWMYDMFQYGGMAGVLFGVVLFFVGAMVFARK